MITAMNHITLAVQDVEKSFEFYRDILNLKPLAKWDKGAYFLVRTTDSDVSDSGFWFCLNLDEKRIPNPCYTHYAFTVSSKNFERLAEKIIAAGAYIFKDNTSPGESLYFLDPDGHKMEIHVGNWRTRIESKKQNLGDWKNVEWFVWIRVESFYKGSRESI